MIGERAIRAAEAKNAQQLFTVGGDIYDACSNCHRQYMDAIVNANKSVFTEVNARFLDEESTRHHAQIGSAVQSPI